MCLVYVNDFTCKKDCTIRFVLFRVFVRGHGLLRFTVPLQQFCLSACQCITRNHTVLFTHRLFISCKKTFHKKKSTCKRIWVSAIGTTCSDAILSVGRLWWVEMSKGRLRWQPNRTRCLPTACPPLRNFFERRCFLRGRNESEMVSSVNSIGVL